MSDRGSSGDLSMEFARVFAEGLGPAPELPSSLSTVENRAKFIHSSDGPFFEGSSNGEIIQNIGRRLTELAKISESYMPDVSDSLARVNLALRMWSGCISAAKTIALETRSGPNTPQMRAETFSKYIDPIAEKDVIYRSGVEAAPAFKKRRNQEYSFQGVPENSPVKRFPA